MRYSHLFSKIFFERQERVRSNIRLSNFFNKGGKG